MSRGDTQVSHETGLLMSNWPFKVLFECNKIEQSYLSVTKNTKSNQQQNGSHWAIFMITSSQSYAIIISKIWHARVHHTWKIEYIGPRIDNDCREQPA